MNCYQSCYYQCKNDAVTELIKRDAKLTVKNIANSICIPPGSVHKILIQQLKLREGCAPSLEQKCYSYENARIDHYIDFLVTKTLYALWQHYGVQKFYSEAILFGKNKCRTVFLFDYLQLCVPVNNEALMFPIGILGQVWYLIVSFPNLCTLTLINCFKKS